MTPDESAKRLEIEHAEAMIESAMWENKDKDDHQAELDAYNSARKILENLSGLTPTLEKERNRVLSYCLLRTDEVLMRMDNENETLERVSGALKLAENSGDDVQIARCYLALGIRLLNQGQIAEAEKNWRKVFELAEGFDDNDDMQQVLAWTLLARAHVVNAKSLYNQALAILVQAEGILIRIKNYAGLAAVHNLYAQVYAALGEPDKAEASRKYAAEYRELSSKESR